MDFFYLRNEKAIPGLRPLWYHLGEIYEHSYCLPQVLVNMDRVFSWFFHDFSRRIEVVHYHTKVEI